MEASRRAALKKRKRNWRLRRTQFCQKTGGGHIFIFPQMYKREQKERHLARCLFGVASRLNSFHPFLEPTTYALMNGAAPGATVSTRLHNISVRESLLSPRPLSSCAGARRRRETGANDDASWVFLFTAVYGRGREGERKRRERRSRIRGVYQISYGPRAVLGSNDRWNRGSAR